MNRSKLISSVLFCFFLIGTHHLFGSIKKAKNFEVITGLMGRGKTEKLINICETAQKKEISVLALFNHLELGRQKGKKENGFYTRNGEFFPATPVKNVQETIDKYEEFKRQNNEEKLVALDEGHLFFGESLLPIVKAITKDKETRLVIGGLLYNFLKEKFENINELLPLANHTRLDPGKCVACNKNKAKWMQIFFKGKKPPSRSTNPIFVGDEEYERRCDDCHIVLD